MNFKNIKKIAQKIWNDESGQGATEYILLLVVVVALVLMFGPQFRTAIEDKVNSIRDQIAGFSG